jgi:hypothetical protein
MAVVGSAWMILVGCVCLVLKERLAPLIASRLQISSSAGIRQLERFLIFAGLFVFVLGGGTGAATIFPGVAKCAVIVAVCCDLIIGSIAVSQFPKLNSVR